MKKDWVGWGKLALDELGHEQKDAFIEFLRNDPGALEIYADDYQRAIVLFCHRDDPDIGKAKEQWLKEITWTGILSSGWAYS